MDEDQQLHLSDEARALMRSDVAQEAFKRAENAFMARWRAGKTVEEREGAHHSLSALDELKRQLQAMQDVRPMIEARKRQRGRA